MRRIFFTVAAAAPLILNAQSFADAPPLWTELDFAEAREKAAAEDRVLLVYATASWCPPCRMMERSTWQSEGVHEWFAEHGVAYKLDVDHQRDLAQAHDVEFMPTMIAYRNNEPFDRIGGYKSDRELLDWLGNVREGKRAVDVLLEAAGDRVGSDGRVDVQARMNLAGTLAHSGAVDEAIEEYLWLWDNMLEHSPAMYGVRLSFMIGDMSGLAQQNRKAREAFRERRAEYLPRIKERRAHRQDVIDWIVLAEVTGEQDSLLAWFDSVKDDAAGRQMLRHGERQLSEALIEAGRWAEVTLLYDDPVGEARARIDADRRFEEQDIEGWDAEMVRDMVRSNRRINRERFSQMYAVLLAADRDDEAEQIAQLLLEWDDSTAARGALVTRALKAGEARLRHLQWVDEAEGMGARVPRARRELEEALGR